MSMSGCINVLHFYSICISIVMSENNPHLNISISRQRGICNVLIFKCPKVSSRTKVLNKKGIT